MQEEEDDTQKRTKGKKTKNLLGNMEIKKEFKKKKHHKKNFIDLRNEQEFPSLS